MTLAITILKKKFPLQTKTQDFLLPKVSQSATLDVVM